MFSNEWLTTLQTCLTGVLAVVIMSLKVKWNAFFTTLCKVCRRLLGTSCPCLKGQDGYKTLILEELKFST